jgi:hypothetical protein
MKTRKRRINKLLICFNIVNDDSKEINRNSRRWRMAMFNEEMKFISIIIL